MIHLKDIFTVYTKTGGYWYLKQKSSSNNSMQQGIAAATYSLISYQTEHSWKWNSSTTSHSDTIQDSHLYRCQLKDNQWPHINKWLIKVGYTFFFFLEKPNSKPNEQVKPQVCYSPPCEHKNKIGNSPSKKACILDMIGHSPKYSEISTSKGSNTHLWLQICCLKIYQLI